MTMQQLRNGAAGVLTLVLLAWGTVGATHAQTRREPIRPDQLTGAHIDGAIERAIQALYDNPALQPNYGLEREYHGSWLSQPFTTRHAMGNHALTSWALLAAGESYQNPKLYQRINWVFSRDQPLTYDRGMRLLMLAQLPRARWQPWVQRDRVWMTSAVTDKGNFNERWAGGNSAGFGDNANGQYGVLGLWGVERNNLPVPAQTWRAIDTYWREGQQNTPDENAAGWAVFSFASEQRGRTATTFYRRVSGPMTAGGVSTLCLTERYLEGGRMLTPGEQYVSRNLRKGLRWLDENFSIDDKAEETDRYYYFWTMQRVGHATGYKSFKGVDLFRDITTVMLNEQGGDGTWRADKGPLLSTGFAVLYLARAYDPLAVCKIRFNKPDGSPAAWNNRPHDLWNFVDYASDTFEYTTTWQIVELDLAPYSLIESPVLWLATHEKFEFTEKQIANLRGYLDIGGTLVFNPDRPSPDTAQSLQKLCEQLYPNLKLERVPNDHAVFNLHQQIKTPVPMQMLHNGIRPVIFAFQGDMGKGLQANEVATSDSFRILSNIYLYATGLNPRRMRLVNNYVPLVNEAPRQLVKAARIKHPGNWNPEPGAMGQLRNILANDHNINLEVEDVEPGSLSGQDIGFMTFMGEGPTLNEQQASAIRQWVERGGTLFVDVTTGRPEGARAADAALRLIFPDSPIAPLSFDHPVISGDTLHQGYNCRWVSYRNYALKRMGPINRPRIQSVDIGGRVGAFYSTEDITCGLAGLDQWEIYGYTPRFARQLAVNAVLLASRLR